MAIPEVEFWSDWDSLALWRPMRWRDFTVIAVEFETSENKWYEVHFAILGFHCYIQCFKTD